ncbi:MAG: hypothetical protein D6709_02860 [Chloroflexi bacterium]|uniref:Uncharacterized protein n=1 Tax=Candidatus Thermofonsia Clade 3 bacterium TaxID=2364212 RepID=A0A2M8QCE8_9CHLR|nr:hypothetical protein [Candidatus Roseilinea sp. NK_OTU-006]PJF47448.1 MAG: hypothetical protein CUN48_08560 [Candidatus Thermofonsia Clade 3 bacterium]RMG65331.1 MAG: hypothetical protein D6709_02860 [Chloroflexota bacterium]
MNFTSFDQLLRLDAHGVLATAQGAALLIFGDCADALAQQLTLHQAIVCTPAKVRMLFGLPILTAPFPLFVGAVMTERNTLLDQMSAFAWIEDNYIEQPRAEVFGLTPFGEQPVLFMRDFDMDRPVEVWLQAPRPMGWVRVVGAAIATSHRAVEAQLLPPDEAALALMALDLPADAQPFVESLAMDVARGVSLKAALRQRRKTTDPALMYVCDGWRVFSRSAGVVQLNPLQHSPDRVEDVLRLAPPRRW